MRFVLYGLSLAALLCLAGCPATAPVTRALPKPAAVSEVLNKLKDELNVFLSAPYGASTEKGSCRQHPNLPLRLIPVAASVTLLGISTSVDNLSAGLAVPYGALQLDPAGGGSFQRGSSLTMEIPLAIQGVDRKKLKPVPPKDKHQLGDALIHFRDEIMKVDHDRQPCLVFQGDGKNNFKVSLKFDTVNQGTAGLGLQLAMFKLSDKIDTTSEAHQTLDVELVLVEGESTVGNTLFDFRSNEKSKVDPRILKDLPGATHLK